MKLMITAHYYFSILLMLQLLSIKPLLSFEIFNQKEPGEATSSLIQQVSGLTSISSLGTINGSSSSIGVLLTNATTNNNNTVVAHNQTGSRNKIATSTNTSLSSSTSSSMDHQPQQNNDDNDRILHIAIMTANVIIFIIGFIGNLIVILVILKFTRIETVTDIYILNLAVADLMFITGLIFLITTMFKGDWIFGYLMCKLYMASTSLNQFASSLLLVVMSFDRFLAVCHPIYAQRFRRIRTAKTICLCIWIVCLILMSPIFAFAKISKDLTCAIFWPEYKDFDCEVAFTMYSFAIGFAFPLLLIAAFYLCVIRKLRIAASGSHTLGSSRRSRSRETANRRIEHLVIGIICTYTICWAPYWMTQLIVSFITNNTQPVPGFYGIFLTASSLSYTNSALNPILYAFLSDNFKRRCSGILRSIYSFGLLKSQLFGGGGGDNVGSAGGSKLGNGNQTGNSNAAPGGYHAPTATTTGCCETDTTRPELTTRSSQYLSVSVKFIPRHPTSNNHHHHVNESMTGSNNKLSSFEVLDDDVDDDDDDDGNLKKQHLEVQNTLLNSEDTDEEIGSSKIALNCLASSGESRRKSVNFCSNANVIIPAQASQITNLTDSTTTKSYHKIQCDSESQGQGV